MTRSISSAQPDKLLRYADVGGRINRELIAESLRLARALQQFEATCREFPVRVSFLADTARSQSAQADAVDGWVRHVAQGFQNADRWGALVALSAVRVQGITVPLSAYTDLKQRLVRALPIWRDVAAGYVHTFMKMVQDPAIAPILKLVVKSIRPFVKLTKEIPLLLQGFGYRPVDGWLSYYKSLWGGFRGRWAIEGPKSVLKQIGIKPSARLFGDKWIERMLTPRAPNGYVELFGRYFRKKIIFTDLSFKISPAKLWKKMRTRPPIVPISNMRQLFTSVGNQFKGDFALAVIFRVAENYLEFKAPDKWLDLDVLKVRRFWTATGADVLALVPIVIVVAAVGSLAPALVVGVVAKFATGLLLNWVYDKFLKDKWRNFVDDPGSALRKAYDFGARSSGCGLPGIQAQNSEPAGTASPERSRDPGGISFG
jgi:hypothetical protein